MDVIRDKDGKVIRRSRNLRGIREYISKNIVKVLSVDTLGNGSGKLCILFENGCSFQTNFADYSVLCGFVRRWRNAYGSPFLMNGEDAGELTYHNEKLKNW